MNRPAPTANADSDRSQIFLDLGGDMAAHLAVAIDRHRKALAINGVAVPLDLLSLGKAFASRALGRLGPTALEQVSLVSDPPPMPRQLLTYDETAEMLACSTRTVERLIATGQLVAVRVTPNTPRIRVTDLTAYVDSLDDTGKAAS